jgi:hypothetical protein
VATPKNAVLIIDEIDMVDPSSWQVLLRLAKNAKNICLIMSGSPRCATAIDYMSKIVKLRRYDRIVMLPLDEKSIGTLCSSLSEGLEWPIQIVQMLLEATGGNPSQCVELIKTMWATNMVEFEGIDIESVEGGDNSRLK